MLDCFAIILIVYAICDNAMPEKILVVDDDIDSLKLIGLMLQRNGYQVSAANAGHQAIAKATAERPDLIILDIMMPDMNGYEVCRRLRASSETQNIPIIMFTAKTLIDDKVAGFEAGADDYLTKPTHPAELASRVRSILGKRAVQRASDGGSRGVAIGVLGVKGGVGATTLAINMAGALQRMQHSPILVDMRLGSGSAACMLGVERSRGIAELLGRPAADMRAHAIEDHLTSHPSGLHALLSSVSLREAQLGYSLETAVAMIRQLRGLGRPALFDLGTPLSANINRLQREMDILVLVIEAIKSTVDTARALLPQLEAARPVPGRIEIVVVNRVPGGVLTPWHEIEQVLGQDIRAIISPAPELAHQAMAAGMPMVIHQPGAIASTQMIKLTDDLHTHIVTQLDGEIAG